jgi:AIG1 family
VNYLYKANFDDPFRFKLVSEVTRENASASQTDQVIGYLLQTPPALGGNDSLLIIDTPGFGDTRGVGRDMETINEIKEFFSKEITYLHAVCFVVQGNTSRLDNRNRWIFDQVQSLFGNDIGEIITLLMTFSDAAEPPAMAVIKDAQIQYKERFKLNNSAYVLTTTDQAKDHDYRVNSMFWDVGQCAFDAFSKFILSSEKKSLDTTKKVLDRREQLQMGIENVRRYIDIGMNTLANVDSTLAVLIQAQTLIETNKDFKYTVKELESVRRPKKTLYNTVCTNCLWTCHEDCQIKNDGDKMRCWAIDKRSGNCEHCPKKCHWSDHKNLDYYYERVEVEKKRTNKELYDRYINASSDKSKYDQVMEGLKREFDATQAQVYKNVHKIEGMINELQRIALKPCLYHDDEYFDIMIECERKDKQSGWQERIRMIEEVMQRSKLCNQVESGSYDPFAERVAQVKERAVEGKISLHLESHKSDSSCHEIIIPALPKKQKKSFFSAFF